MSENELTTRFMDAAANGDIEALQLCFEQGADINVRGKARRTAILTAAMNDHLEAVEFLISA